MDKIMVTRSSLPPFDEYCEEIESIWNTHWLTNMGEKHNELQKKLIDYLEVTNLELFTNGHMALELSLQALNMKGEVITTPFTFASTTHAIVRNHLTPVFCDIDPDTYTIDCEKIEALISEKTCAIMPVHVYGNVCNVEKIEEIAKKYSLRVIYDAAHTFGERYKGRGIGTFGDVSCFSFHATKVFNSIEGGCACFSDVNLGNELYKLKNFGIRSEEVVDGVGANAKMNEFCAAMGLCNLRHIDDEIDERKRVFERYSDNLLNVKGIKINLPQKNVRSNYAYFPITVDAKQFGCGRDDIFIELQKSNIFSRKYFYPLTSNFDCFGGQFDSSKTPIALDISKRVLTLPMYGELENKDIDEICRIICGMKS